MAEPERVEHWHHSEPPGVRIKLEKNSRGYGWEIAATGETVAAPPRRGEGDGDE